MLRTASFDRGRLAGAAADEFLAATDVADLLVRRGVPFRESHAVVGGLVRHAIDHGKRLSELTREELATFSDHLDDEYYAVLSNGSWLESKVSEGGTASHRVREQLARARDVLAGVEP
jgi:argininosuccinate lyase